MIITLKPVGDAPLLKKNKYKIAATSRFSEVITFVRKVLNLKAEQSLVRFHDMFHEEKIPIGMLICVVDSSLLFFIHLCLFVCL